MENTTDDYPTRERKNATSTETSHDPAVHHQNNEDAQRNCDASEHQQRKKRKAEKDEKIMAMLVQLQDTMQKIEKKMGEMAEQLNPLHEKEEKQKKILRSREIVAKEFLDSIMSKTAKLGSSMSVMNGVVNLESSSPDKILRTGVIIRSNTHIFWKSCLDVVDTVGDNRKRVCVIGTPGFGKTTTTAYLIRMLMKKKNTTVVYCLHQYDSNNFCYKFVSANDNSKPSVAVFQEGSYSDDVTPETYYVVDPCRSERSCNPGLDFQAKVIIVSSPNSKHWGGDGFSKSNGPNTSGVFKYMPSWSLEEVKVAREQLCKNSKHVSEDELSERFNVVDGVVRHLFSSYDDAVDSQKQALKILTLDQARKIVFGNMDCIDTLNGTMPKSCLILYDVNDTTGYDKATTRTVSASVNCMIIKYFKKEFYDMMLNESANKPKIMEDYLAIDLLDGMTCDIRPGVGKKESDRSRSQSTDFNGLKSYRRTESNLLTSAQKEPMVLFSSSNPFHPLYDLCFCDSNGMFHLFQVTIGETHDCKLKNLEDEIKSLDILPTKITLYYAVHSIKYDKFVTKPSNPMQTTNFKIKHLKIQDPHVLQIR